MVMSLRGCPSSSLEERITNLMGSLSSKVETAKMQYGVQLTCGYEEAVIKQTQAAIEMQSRLFRRALLNVLNDFSSGPKEDLIAEYLRKMLSEAEINWLIESDFYQFRDAFLSTKEDIANFMHISFN